MKRPGQQPPPGGFNLQDILYVLFKHKWKILLLTLVGLGAAAVVFYQRKPFYESRAKLLVRYVVDTNPADRFESQVSPGRYGGGHVIEAERELLISEDLAMTVAETLGPERLLPNSDGQATVAGAGAVILDSLVVGAAQGSSVIHVSYSSPDPDLSVEVLSELIQSYFVRHLEIRRSTGAFEFVAKQAEMARSRLRQADDELNKFKAESGILSLEDSMEAIELRRSDLLAGLLSAEADLEGQRAKVRAIEAVLGMSGEGETATVAKDDDGGEPEGAASQAERRADSIVLDDYRALAQELDALRAERIKLLETLTPTNRRIVKLDQRIAEIKDRGLELIDQHPELVGHASTTPGEQILQDPRSDLDDERAILASLTAKTEILRSQVEAVEKEVESIAVAGVQMETLQRRKQLEEENAIYLESSLDKAKVNEALDPAKMPNISMVQAPSVPREVFGSMTRKLIMGLAVGGMALGVGLAFLIELVIDRRIKRSTDISARMQLPLMLAIPYYRLKERGGALLTYDEGSVGTDGGEDLILPPVRETGLGVSASGKSDHFILPYSKAIRDRIIFGFEANRIRHKPKLVALTGLSDDAGTSTIAAGVAKAFAEAEGLKVLFVDLSPDTSSANSMLGGRAAQSLDGVLRLTQGDRLESASQNLFVASGTSYSNGDGPTPLAPMQLYGLIPKLQASDFDYIIFDMPPIDPTSPTLAMAGFMDKVLLVLDADHTSREDLQWGYSELARGTADVSCIYNKARSHAPRWVEGVT